MKRILVFLFLFLVTACSIPAQDIPNEISEMFSTSNQPATLNDNKNNNDNNDSNNNNDSSITNVTGDTGIVIHDASKSESAFSIILDRKDKTYKKGENFTFKFCSKIYGYLYVFSATGNKPALLFPNKWDVDNKIKPGITRILPPPESPYTWRISGDHKVEKLIIILSESPLENSKAMELLFNDGKTIDIVQKDSKHQVIIELNVVSSSQQTQPQNTVKRIACLFFQTHKISAETKKFKIDNVIQYRIGNYIRIKKALIDFGKFNDILCLAGPKLSKENVINTFAKIKEMTNPNDEILIYWEGHGMPWPDDDSGSEEDGKHESFLLATTHTNKNNKVLPTRETVLQDDEFAELILTLSQRKVMVIVESCHSGGLFNSKFLDMENQLLQTNKEEEQLENIQQTMDTLVNQSYDYADFLQYIPKFFDLSDLKSVSRESNSNALHPEISDLINNSSEEKVYTNRLIKKLTNSTKDVPRNHPQLSMMVSCRENESAWCNLLIPTSSDKYKLCGLKCGDDLIPISPITFSLLTVLTDTKGRFTKNSNKVDFDDFCKIASDIIQINGKRIAQCLSKEEPKIQKEQKPVFINNIGQIFLKP